MKKGQIAHLDRRRSNNLEDNLAFLCLEHHSEYDSLTSQHKNYTIAEVKSARRALHRWLKRNPSPSVPDGQPARDAKLGSPHPIVLLFPISGTKLRVESLRADAINVRLVPAESREYRLSSEVIRYLRIGTSEALVLLCEAKGHGGTGVPPSEFFLDLAPLPDTRDAVELANRVIRYLTEEQLALPLEVAYSTVSGTDHYRSSFLVRWEPLSQSIVDFEPKGVRPDKEPPSTAPANVLPAPPIPRLNFQEWHGGAERSFPLRWGSGVPTWIAVENTQAAPAKSARNVTGRLEFIASGGEVRFVVPRVSWYQATPSQASAPSSGLNTRKTAIDIEGGGERSFALFIQADQRKLLVYRNLDEEPVGELDYDQWRVRILVCSDNAYGFEGNLSFTFTRSSLIPNRPAFVKVRDVPPLVMA